MDMAGYYAYRLPLTDRFICRRGPLTSLQECEGFLITPFHHDSGEHWFIKGDGNLDLYAIPVMDMNETPAGWHDFTSKETHINNVTTVSQSLAAGEKCVISRLVRHQGVVNIPKTLEALSLAYPTSMVFCFSSAETGTWLGASPEILLSRKGNRLSTMALAGTRQVNDDAEWDEKNLEEQRIVFKEICRILENNNLIPVSDGQQYSSSFGRIEHLRTDITTYCNDNAELSELIKVAMDLAPTPALGGYPTSNALKMISTIEKFDRNCYGGFCGPVSETGDFNLYALLRSICVDSEGWHMIAGGGITSASDPDKEWLETENKITAISRFIKYTAS